MLEEKPENSFLSQQFLLFILAGGISAIGNFFSRIIFNLYLSFSFSIILAYIVGMIIAFVLARIFVFKKSRQSVTRSAAFFFSQYVFDYTNLDY